MSYCERFMDELDGEDWGRPVERDSLLDAGNPISAVTESKSTGSESTMRMRLVL